MSEAGQVEEFRIIRRIGVPPKERNEACGKHNPDRGEPSSAACPDFLTVGNGRLMVVGRRAGTLGLHTVVVPAGVVLGAIDDLRREPKPVRPEPVYPNAGINAQKGDLLVTGPSARQQFGYLARHGGLPPDAGIGQDEGVVFTDTHALGPAVDQFDDFLRQRRIN